MKRIKGLIAGLLKLTVISVLFAGSCMGPALLYYQSPRWLLNKVENSDIVSFYVAFRSRSDEVPEQVNVMRYTFDSENGNYSGVQFHLPNGRLHGFGPGKGSATINATADEQGGQIVQVFVTGDTPWTSLSEYRVLENKIYPLRHAHSAAWLLVGAVVCPLLIIALIKPIKRGINRFMRIAPE
jgi:hypothetical protein